MFVCVLAALSIVLLVLPYPLLPVYGSAHSACLYSQQVEMCSPGLLVFWVWWPEHLHPAFSTRFPFYFLHRISEILADSPLSCSCPLLWDVSYLVRHITENRLYSELCL